METGRTKKRGPLRIAAKRSSSSRGSGPSPQAVIKLRILVGIDSRPGPGASCFLAGRALPTSVRTLSPISTSWVAVAESHSFGGEITRSRDSALRQIHVHDMCGDDLGITHVPTPVETGDLILLERVGLPRSGWAFGSSGTVPAWSRSERAPGVTPPRFGGAVSDGRLGVHLGGQAANPYEYSVGAPRFELGTSSPPD